MTMIVLPVSKMVFVFGLVWRCVTSATADYSYSLYGKTYRISVGDDRKSGDAARTKCRGEQGTLVDIRSDEEVTHLVGAIQTLGGVPALGRSYLVGGVYKTSLWETGKMIWYYENDNVMTYTKWASGQTVNGANHACITMKASNDNGKWHNADCGSGTDGYHYICAREASGVFKYGFYGNTYYVPIGGDDGVTGVAAARDKCKKDLDGELADIHSAEELQHVKRVIHSLNNQQNAVSMWHFVIGGKKKNDNWVYEDGTSMTYTNWIPDEETKDGCAVLDPDYPNQNLTVTTISTKNHRVVNCKNASFHYICSKKVTGFYMHMTGDYVVGNTVSRNCRSYTTNEHKLEFVVHTAEPSLLNEITWLQHTERQLGYQNDLPTETKTYSFTKVTYRSIDFSYIPHRRENGLLIYCQQYGNAKTLSENYTLTVAYPPSEAVIFETNNLIEGKNSVITVTAAESFPQSHIAIQFKPKNAAVINHKQNNNTEKYTGFVAVSTITFNPDRSDNNKSITVRVSNARFPALSIDKTNIVQIYFAPKNVEILNFENMLEGIQHEISISCDEGLPKSTIKVEFPPQQTQTISIAQHTVGSYHGFRSVFKYSFTPSREFNGKLFKTNVYNEKIPGLDLKQEKTVEVYFQSNSIAIVNISNITEGVSPQVITVICEESLPKSIITIDFAAHDTAIHNQVTYPPGLYNGRKALSTYSFTPNRRDNKKIFMVRLTNEKFPDRLLTHAILVNFPPSSVTLSDMSNIFENVEKTFEISTDEGLPQSRLQIEFSSVNTLVKLPAEGTTYNVQYGGYITREKYQFRPSRRDNGKPFEIEVKNQKFPKLSLLKTETIIVHFPPLDITISGTSNIKEGERTTIEILVDESFPKSTIQISFNPWHSSGVTNSSQTIHNDQNYGGSQAKMTYRFLANRLDNEKLFSATAKNSKFDDLYLKKNKTIVVNYPPSRLHILYRSPMIEGREETIKIESDESYPRSKIHINFAPSNGTKNHTRIEQKNGKSYPGYTTISNYAFTPRREDNGKKFNVYIKNQEFKEVNVTNTTTILVYFYAHKLSSRINKKQFLEGQIVNITCVDDGAYPHSTIQFPQLKNIDAVDMKNHKRWLGNASFKTIISSRTVTLPATSNLNNNIVGCSAHHDDFNATANAYTRLVVFYIHPLVTGKLAITKPGNMSIPIDAHPKRLFYNISDFEEVVVASGSTWVEKGNIAFVSIPDKLRVGDYRLVLYNEYGQIKHVQLEYACSSHIQSCPSELPSSSSETSTGLQTDHIIAFLIGGVVFSLCIVGAVLIYVRLRGVILCPTQEHKIVGRRPALEALPLDNIAKRPDSYDKPVEDEGGYESADESQFSPAVCTANATLDEYDSPNEAAATYDDISDKLPPPPTNLTPDNPYIQNASIAIAPTDEYDPIMDPPEPYDTVNPATFVPEYDPLG